MRCPGCKGLGIEKDVAVVSELEGLPPRVLSLAVSGEFTNQGALEAAVRAFPAVRPPLAARVAEPCSYIVRR